jgi:hypothetical protein
MNKEQLMLVAVVLSLALIVLSPVHHMMMNTSVSKLEEQAKVAKRARVVSPSTKQKWHKEHVAIEQGRNKMMKKQGYEKVANVAVDSGFLIVADPGYIMHTSAKRDLGETWEDFADNVHEGASRHTKQLLFDQGHKGLGVVILQHDGLYDVWAAHDNDGNINEIRMLF